MERLGVGSADVEVELLPELGGRWHRLRAFGHELLRTPRDVATYREEPFFWGSFVMAPWCNRVDAGPQTAAGRVVYLESNFGDGTAIHGQVEALPWEILGPGTLRVAAGGDAWPWRYEVMQRLAVEDSRLRLSLELANRSPDPMPAGLGLHPWLIRPLEVELRAASVFASNLESTPQPVAVSGDHDLRRLRAMPANLDATWTDLRHPDVARLRWPGLGVAATLTVSPEGRCLCAASPAAFGAVAVEAQTHAPNGLRRLSRREQLGLRILEPGEALRLEMELAFTRLDA